MTPPRPIEVKLTPEGLLIDCLLVYNRRALDLPEKEGEKAPSLASAIEKGIRAHWSGSWPLCPSLSEALALLSEQKKAPFDLTSRQALEVKLRIERIDCGRLTPALFSLKRSLTRQRRPVRIYVRPSLLLPAHVASPLHRRLWGIFKSGQIESIGLNWSPRQPGYMVIPSQTPAWRLAGVAAHEAGHLFGLGDAYEAWYRFYFASPGTEGYMMRDNGKVQTEELAMLIRAQATGRMQYFPKQFRLSSIKTGLGRSLARLFRKIKAKCNP